MFTHTTRVRLGDTDAAEVMYFARQFEVMHEAFEEFMAARDVSVAYILNDAPFSLAVAHAESDYAAPVRIGELITTEVRVERVGSKSFTIAYTLRNELGEVTGTGQTVHVTLDKVTRRARVMPAELVEALGSVPQVG